MPVNDSWIAATAMALEVPVIARGEDYVEWMDCRSPCLGVSGRTGMGSWLVKSPSLP